MFKYISYFELTEDIQPQYIEDVEIYLKELNLKELLKNDKVENIFYNLTTSSDGYIKIFTNEKLSEEEIEIVEDFILEQQTDGFVLEFIEEDFGIALNGEHIYFDDFVEIKYLGEI